MFRKTSRIGASVAMAVLFAGLTGCQQATSTESPPVYGTPTAEHGGAGTVCPGEYFGYAEYTDGWKLMDPTKNGMAWDASANKAHTKVFYYGVPFANQGCSTNIPKNTCVYRFKVYFLTEPIPSGPYPLSLKNFTNS